MASTADPNVLKNRVAEVIGRIRQAIRADGGDIELVEVAGDVVKVRFLGACVGCPSSPLTLQMGIERSIREHIPEIQRVIAVS
jgi:Fe-S cluster biogenesis protein NfuA